MKELCVSHAWFRGKEKRKVTVIMGENEKEIGFVLVKKQHRHNNMCWSANFLGTFQGFDLMACVEVCWKKRGRSKGDTWWWNEEVKEAVSRKKHSR